MRCAALVVLQVVLCAVSVLVHAREGGSTPPWTVTRAADPIYGTTNVKVVFGSEPDPLAGEGASGRELRVACLAGALDVTVDWPFAGVLGAFASVFGSRGIDLDVRVRFDDGAPRAMVWRVAPDAAGAGVGDPSAFLEELARHRRVAVRVSRPNQPLTAVFDVTGAGPVLKEVRDGCAESAVEIARVEARLRRAVEAERALRDASDREARQQYIAPIRQKVERNWLRPPGAPAGLKCVVRVSQIPGGEVVGIAIQTSSGNVAFDRSVEEAVLRSSPLPVPKDPSWFDRHILITFDPEA